MISGRQVFSPSRNTDSASCVTHPLREGKRIPVADNNYIQLAKYDLSL